MRHAGSLRIAQGSVGTGADSGESGDQRRFTHRETCPLRSHIGPPLGPVFRILILLFAQRLQPTGAEEGTV